METPLTPSEFIKRMMGMLHRQFYPDASKEFYQDQNILKQCITAPAAYLKARGVKVPLHRQGEIFQTIVTTIKQNGNTGKIKRFSAYLLHCVQTHLQHHGEDYYDEGKRLRDTLADVMLRVRPADSKIVDPGDSTDILAEIHAALVSRGGRKKKTATPAKALQLDFLDHA